MGSIEMKIEELLLKECGIVIRNLKDGSYYCIFVLIKMFVYKFNFNI